MRKKEHTLCSRSVKHRRTWEKLIETVLASDEGKKNTRRGETHRRLCIQSVMCGIQKNTHGARYGKTNHRAMFWIHIRISGAIWIIYDRKTLRRRRRGDCTKCVNSCVRICERACLWLQGGREILGGTGFTKPDLS